MERFLRIDARVLPSCGLANQGDGVSKELNDRVLSCVRAWGVAIERTAATPTSLIVHGKRAGVPVVLKVVKQEGDEWRCGEIAAKFGGRGVVQVHEHMAGAALFEKLDPGEPLAALTLAGRDDEATEILAMLLGRMAPGDPPEGCATVEQWAGAFVRHAGSGDERVPSALVEPAQRIYSDLCRTQRNPALLHGDLHHYNVLSDRARGWCAIDVKGVVGELEYELGAALRNPIDRPDLFASLDVVERRSITSGWCSVSTRAARAAGASRKPCCRRFGASRMAMRQRPRRR
jgi:streptomycin 6-kinase